MQINKLFKFVTFKYFIYVVTDVTGALYFMTITF